MPDKRITRAASDAINAFNDCIIEIELLEAKIVEHENYIDQLKDQISDLKSELKSID